MLPQEGVIPTFIPQGVGKGNRPKWHGHRAGGKGGTGTLANIVEHAGGRRGKPAVSLPVGAGPGAWVRPSILTGCGIMLGLGAFCGEEALQLVQDLVPMAKCFDWVWSNAWPWII